MSKKLILNEFFKLDKNDIINGINAIYDKNIFDALLNEKSNALDIVFDFKLQEIAYLWIECEKDELLTRLNY